MCAAKQDLPGLEFVINIAAAAAFFSQFWVCRYPANCLLGTIDFILKGVIIKKNVSRYIPIITHDQL